MAVVQTLFICISLLSPIFAQTQTCGGPVSGQNGQISTPNYPNNYNEDTTCKWVIEVPTGSIVELKFTSFDIDNTEDNCEDDDVVQIFDGANESSPALHTRLCGQKLPRDFASSGNKMTVVFRSTEFSFGAKGFLATYTAKPADQKQCVFSECGGIIENMENGKSCKLQSPGYPVGYAKNLNCTWTIRAPVGGNVLFQFKDLMFYHLSSLCGRNNVTLYHGNDRTKEIYEPVCDMNKNHLDGNPPFKSNGESLTIVLRTSEGSSLYPGFFANFQILPPPGASSTTSSSTTQSTTTVLASTTTGSTTTTATTTTMAITTTKLYKAVTSRKATPTVSTTTTTKLNNEPISRLATRSKISSETPTSSTPLKTTTTDQNNNVPISGNPAAVSGLVIGCIIGVVVIVFSILLIIAFCHWKRQNRRFNIRLREEDAQSDVNTLISNTDSRETVYKGKKYGKIVRIPTNEEFPL